MKLLHIICDELMTFLMFCSLNWLYGIPLFVWWQQ